MEIIRRALRQYADANGPLRIGMIGAGFMGRPVAQQITRYVAGMEIAAIASRKIEDAVHAYRNAGVEETVRVDSVAALALALQHRQPAVMEDGLLLCQAEGIDVVLDMTGNAPFAARAALSAFAHGKHFITYTAELVSVAGSILDHKAREAGVAFSMADGDQPGVIMNLWHFVNSIGIQPLVCGNIKGLQDPYRNPTTQEGFARQWNQKPHMVTSFADGTKVSFEMSVIANATGMRAPKRGLNGFDLAPGFPVEDLTRYYDYEALKDTEGIVDYVVGASPAPGIYIIGGTDDPVQRQYLRLYKLGEGPLYTFYRPYHLCHFEVGYSIARAVLLHDPVLTTTGPARVEVVAIAKRDLKAGEVLDGIGYYMTYGECENASVVQREGLLPILFAAGCRLKHDLRRDTAIRLADVEQPAGDILRALYEEQMAMFPVGI
ncbi:MAG: NAD(P)-dependent oxidoreductase [Anaerolineae bacterium]|nr:NAD(P)-dependent oxidoreductase [Anaerolineae bacterium]